MNLSLKSTGKTSEMMRKVGLEADSGVRRVILLQGFATRSLQFNIFLTAIIWLSTAEASIMFSHRKKSLRRFELKDEGRCAFLYGRLAEKWRTLSPSSCRYETTDHSAWKSLSGCKKNLTFQNRRRILLKKWLSNIAKKGYTMLYGKSRMNNAKIVIPSGSELVNVIGEMAGVMPLTK